jgi:predicted transcriptional regulator
MKGENMEIISIQEKNEVRELRLDLKRYIESFTYPPKQVDLARELKISESVLSNFLTRPEKPLAPQTTKRIRKFLEKKNG